MRDDALYKLKHLTDEEKAAVRTFEEGVRQELYGDIILLEVFGSKVRGDYGPESDIDVLVLVKRITPPVMEKIAAVSSDISIRHGVLISTVVLSEREYNKNRDANTLFIREIEKNGIVLYAA